MPEHKSSRRHCSTNLERTWKRTIEQQTILRMDEIHRSRWVLFSCKYSEASCSLLQKAKTLCLNKKTLQWYSWTPQEQICFHPSKFLVAKYHAKHFIGVNNYFILFTEYTKTFNNRILTDLWQQCQWWDEASNREEYSEVALARLDWRKKD